MSAPQPLQPSSLRSALPWVAFVTLLFCINYTNRAILGPLLVYLEHDLALDHTQATGLLLFQSTGFGVSIFLSGFAVAKIPPRRMVALSCLGCGLVLLGMTRIESHTAARILFACLGMACGLYFTAAMATLGSLVDRRDWSKTVAVHELAPPISFIIAPLLAEAGVAFAGWQGALGGMAIVSLLGGFAFLFWGKGGTALADPPSLQGLDEAAHSPVFWLFSWLFALGVAAEFAPYSVLPLSLTTERGFSPEEASKLLSLSRLLAPFAVLLGGWVTPKLGGKRTLQLFLLVGAASLMALASPWLPVAFIGMVLQPLAPAFAFPAIFQILADSFPARRQPMLLAISVPVASYTGTGVMTQLLGASGDYLSFSTGFILMGLLFVLSLPLLRVLPAKR